MLSILFDFDNFTHFLLFEIKQQISFGTVYKNIYIIKMCLLYYYYA